MSIRPDDTAVSDFKVGMQKVRRQEAKTNADPSLAYPICDGAPGRSLRDDKSKVWVDE